MTQYTVTALYKFARLTDLEKMQSEIQTLCDKLKICGTLLIAEEGINGTIAGSADAIKKILQFLKSYPPLHDLEHKESFADEEPFYRMKVRIKKEIVTIGIPEVNPNEMVGTYLNPDEWNKVISDPDTILIDTRNDYEVNIGTFKGAINPNTKTFREFPDYVKRNLDNQKHKKVAMFCTGGIRCEKASAYMKKLGFEEVYHLKGGILKYLEQMPIDKSIWEGECFVFDQRVSVKHGLEIGNYDLCPCCRHPISAEDKQSPKYIWGVLCPHCYDSVTPEKRASAAERHKQMQLAKARGEKHIGYNHRSEADDD